MRASIRPVYTTGDASEKACLARAPLGLTPAPARPSLRDVTSTARQPSDIPRGMMRQGRLAPRLVLLSCLLLLAGCVSSGDSKILPPAPTASPGSAGAFVYVAEATDPVLGTSGGRVSVYQLGADGSLPGAPFTSAPVVNPRRLVRHPTLPILYVAGMNQIFAFDIAGGRLVSLCGEGAGLAPPCATDPRPGADPLDMSVVVNDAGDYLLYVVEEGNGQGITIQTRVAAYQLGPEGELPANASSQADTFDSASYQGAALVSDLGYLYAGDTGAGLIRRFTVQPDGELPNPPTSPTPVGAPTPTPTPPPPSPTPSPSPSFVKADGPGRMIALAVPPSPSPGTGQTVLYAVLQYKNRIAAYTLSTPIPDQPGTGGDFTKDPSSESNTRGIYNAILIDPAITHIYGAAFNDGQIDFYQLDAAGQILDDTQGSTFADTTSYPTGLAWLEHTPPGGATQRTVLVSLGGSNRIDAYAVQPDGSLPERPFSSTTPIDGTFPADVLVFVP